MEQVTDRDARVEFRRFAKREIEPFASKSDLQRRLEPSVIESLRNEGFLGCNIHPDFGGKGLSQVSYGLLTAEVGRACSSARTLMTVHHLVSAAVLKWASTELRASLIPLLATGAELAAFALSETGAGSDPSSIKATVRRIGSDFVLSGEKRWVSFGQLATIFLVVGRSADGVTALLIPADTPGVRRYPIDTIVATRAGMMADVVFDDCRVSANFLLGRPGFGFSHVCGTALDHGRYSVAWGAVGVTEAAVSSAWRYAQDRVISGEALKDKPLMRARLTRIATAARAARALCMDAGHLRDMNADSALVETIVAKYAASKAAVYAANQAVQIHGARGLLENEEVERLLRDAKLTEIIEGSSDTLELLLGEQGLGAEL